MLDAGGIHNDLLNVLHNRGGAFERGRVGELDIDVGVALVFVWKKARWDTAREKSCGDAKHQQQHRHKCALPHQHSAPTYIAVGQSLEEPVERIEKSPQ